MAQINKARWFSEMGRELTAALLEKREVVLPGALPDFEKPRVFGREVEDLLAAAGDNAIAAIEAELDRCRVMEDEAGDIALFDVAHRRDGIAIKLDAMDSRAKRAAFMIVHHEDLFREAEYRRHSNHYRRTKYWSRFRAAVPSVDVAQVAAQPPPSAFREELSRSHPERRPVEVEISHAATRPSELMVAIFSAEAARQIHTYESGAFTNRPIREASTSTLLFDASTGLIEVAGKYWKSTGHEKVAKAFVELLLERDSTVSRVVPTGFILAPIVFAASLDIDPDDDIAAVEVVSARFPCGTPPRGVFTWRRKSAEPIMAEIEANLGREAAQRLRMAAPDHVELKVTPRPKADASRATPFSVSIHADGNTNLREITHPQKLLLEKYLPRWGVIEVDEEPMVDYDAN